MTATDRDAPPSLEFQPPKCPMCGEYTQFEGDHYLCEACECGWDFDGVFTSWVNEEAAQCDETVRPWAENTFIPADAPYKNREFRCLLDKDHVDNEWSKKHAHPDVNGVLWAKGWR